MKKAKQIIAGIFVRILWLLFNAVWHFIFLFIECFVVVTIFLLLPFLYILFGISLDKVLDFYGPFNDFIWETPSNIFNHEHN